MSKKNRSRPLTVKEIEAEIQKLMTSDYEDTDDDNSDEDFADILNKRLDEIQNITTGDLLNILNTETERESKNTVNQGAVSPSIHSAELLNKADQENQLIQPQDLGIEANHSSFGAISSLPVAPPSPSSPTVSETVTLTQLNQKERYWSMSIENEEFPVFETKAKPTIAYKNRHLPIDYFQHMFTSNIIDILVENTNLYAIKNQSKYWTETNNEEMLAFLGVIIMMGLTPLADVELYWSTDDFYNPIISRVMTLKRYKKLIENFHISNPNIELARIDPNYDKLSKIRPLIEIINNNFSNMCSQSSSQSIDESMVKFKGRSSMKQYMPNKPIKRGYKVWARCDSVRIPVLI